MLGPKLKISKNTIEKVKAAALTLGVSPEEFAEKALLKECDKVLMQGGAKTVSKEEEEEIAKQLQGLGYLD